MLDGFIEFCISFSLSASPVDIVQCAAYVYVCVEDPVGSVIDGASVATRGPNAV